MARKPINLNIAGITDFKYARILFDKIEDEKGLNVRDDLKYTVDPDLEELAFNIAQHGLRQPIVVYESDKKGSYQVLHGSRRLAAIKLIVDKDELENFLIEGIDENKQSVKAPFKIDRNIKNKFTNLDCIIVSKPESEAERVLLQIAENEARKDVDNLELSHQYNKLLKSKYNSEAFNQAKLCELTGKSKSTISEIISIIKIDQKIQKLIQEIQLYGQSKEKFVTTNSKFDHNKTLTKSIVGVRPLYKIAEAKNQAYEFWKHFGKLCELSDAKEIGLTEKDIEKIENETTTKKDKFLVDYGEINSLIKQLKSEEDEKNKKMLQKKAKSKSIGLIKKLIKITDLSEDDLRTLFNS